MSEAPSAAQVAAAACLEYCEKRGFPASKLDNLRRTAGGDWSVVLARAGLPVHPRSTSLVEEFAERRCAPRVASGKSDASVAPIARDELRDTADSLVSGHLHGESSASAAKGAKGARHHQARTGGAGSASNKESAAAAEPEHIEVTWVEETLSAAEPRIEQRKDVSSLEAPDVVPPVVDAGAAGSTSDTLSLPIAMPVAEAARVDEDEDEALFSGQPAAFVPATPPPEPSASLLGASSHHGGVQPDAAAASRIQEEARQQAAKALRDAQAGRMRPAEKQPRKRRPWGAEEVANLRRGVERHGEGRWETIRLAFPFDGRTNVDLKDKWRNLVLSGEGVGADSPKRPRVGPLEITPQIVTQLD
jgi:hypothetical protein